MRGATTETSREPTRISRKRNASKRLPELRSRQKGLFCRYLKELLPCLCGFRDIDERRISAKRVKPNNSARNGRRSIHCVHLHRCGPAYACTARSPRFPSTGPKFDSSFEPSAAPAGADSAMCGAGPESLWKPYGHSGRKSHRKQSAILLPSILSFFFFEAAIARSITGCATFTCVACGSRWS